jgi:serine-type D-Ala-D-Ala carboxypeptidase (penicillin-binding protein 5/6)
MRKCLVTMAVAISSLVLVGNAWADATPAVQPAATAQTTPPAPAAASTDASQPLLLPSAPSLNAKAYALIDANSGTVLAEKNADAKRPPASLTKLMTLYLTQRALKQGVIQADDKVRISKDAWKTGGSRMFVKVGSHVPVTLLTQGVIVDSGNDATMALAEYVGGSVNTFVDMMNKQAALLGMTNSHFSDPTGLPAPDHLTTAMDLAKLARAVWIQFPAYHDWFKQKWLSYNGIRQPNRNRLLWRFPGALGMKTGHTDAAGYCLIAVAKRDGMTLISVVLGAPTDEDRSDDSIRLLNYGFRFFNTHLLYQANSAISKARVWYGDEKTVPVGATQDVYITAPRGQYQNVKVNVDLNANIKAPVKKGQALGSLNAILADKTMANYPLVALADDLKGGWWRHASDGVSHKVSGWFGK